MGLQVGVMKGDTRSLDCSSYRVLGFRAQKLSYHIMAISSYIWGVSLLCTKEKFPNSSPTEGALGDELRGYPGMIRATVQTP